MGIFNCVLKLLQSVCKSVFILGNLIKDGRVNIVNAFAVIAMLCITTLILKWLSYFSDWVAVIGFI